MAVNLLIKISHKSRFMRSQLIKALSQNFSARYSNMNRSKVFVTRSDVPEAAINLLKESCDVEMATSTSIERNELLNKVKDKNGLYCFLADRVNDELLQAAGPQLKVIGTMSVGCDHIDIEACKSRGVLVGNTPDVLTDATAELCVALLLATSRRIVEASKEVTNGGWKRANKWGPMYMTGSQLKGSTVGIIGLGRIGFAVAKRVKSFEVKDILYSGNTVKNYGESINAKFVPFDELLKRSDFVIVTCPLTPATEGLFGAAEFKKMKSNAIFVNISRGAICNQTALYDALTSGEIKAAGLDVTTPEPLPEDHPLTELKNCVILPHIGSATVETRIEMAMLTSRNIIAGLKGLQLPAAVY